MIQGGAVVGFDTGRWEALALCPFYQRTEKERHRITCEGIMSGSRLALVFLSADAKRVRHLESYCCRDYMKCPLYEAIYKQYEEDKR